MNWRRTYLQAFVHNFKTFLYSYNYKKYNRCNWVYDSCFFSDWNDVCLCLVGAVVEESYRNSETKKFEWVKRTGYSGFLYLPNADENFWFLLMLVFWKQPYVRKYSSGIISILGGWLRGNTAKLPFFVVLVLNFHIFRNYLECFGNLH